MPQLRVDMSGDRVIDTAFYAVVYASAGSTIPVIGAGGGALFGAVAYLSLSALSHVQNRISQHLYSCLTPSAAEVVKVALSALGGMMAGWAALAAAGFSLTLASVVVLSCVGVMTVFMTHTAFACVACALEPRPPLRYVRI